MGAGNRDGVGDRLWHQSAPAARTAGVRAGPYDVAVVGAGLTGLCTAVRLAGEGCRVVVLEARHVGAGTSGASTAKISALQGTRLSSIAEQHAGHVVAQYLAGNLAGLRWLTDFGAARDVAYQWADAVTYAATAEELPAVEKEHEVCRSLGLDVGWRDDDGPFPFAGGTVLADQAQVDPMALLDALEAAAVSAGAELYTGVRVTDVEGGDEPSLTTSGGTVRADRVVLATGIPIADRGGFFARLVPERSYAMALRVPGLTASDMYLSAGAPGRSVRTTPVPTAPDQDGPTLLLGGSGHEAGKVESERAMVDDLARWAAQHFPDGTVTHRWSAQDYRPIDGLPYVGPLTPTDERVLVATGYAKWGLAASAAAATILSARLTGAPPPEWSEAFASWSAHEVSGVPTGVGHNVQVAADLVGGRASALTTPLPEPTEGSGTVGREEAHLVAASRIDGEVHRLSASCPHLGGVLSWNDAECTWDCPLHGSRFTASGELLEGPATEDMRPVS